jgi:hypothetical protein
MGCGTSSQGQVLRAPQSQQPSMQSYSPAAPQPQQFAVQIPPGVQPGGIFIAMVNGQQLQVQVPPGMGAGQQLLIQAPAAQQQVYGPPYGQQPYGQTQSSGMGTGTGPAAGLPEKARVVANPRLQERRSALDF